MGVMFTAFQICCKNHQRLRELWRGFFKSLSRVSCIFKLWSCVCLWRTCLSIFLRKGICHMIKLRHLIYITWSVYDRLYMFTTVTMTDTKRINRYKHVCNTSTVYCSGHVCYGLCKRYPSNLHRMYTLGVLGLYSYCLGFNVRPLQLYHYTWYMFVQTEVHTWLWSR